MLAVEGTIVEKDLAALRLEYRQLSTTIFRLDLLRLAFLLLFAMALSSTFRKVNDQKIKDARKDFASNLTTITAEDGT